MKKSLLHLVNIAVSGAAAGALAAFGGSFVGTPLQLKQIGVAAVGGAIVATVRHLQQSPLISEIPTAPAANLPPEN